MRRTRARYHPSSQTPPRNAANAFSIAPYQFFPADRQTESPLSWEHREDECDHQEPAMGTCPGDRSRHDSELSTLPYAPEKGSDLVAYPEPETRRRTIRSTTVSPSSHERTSQRRPQQGEGHPSQDRVPPAQQTGAAASGPSSGRAHDAVYLPDNWIPVTTTDTAIFLPPPHELAPAPPTPQSPRKLSLDDFQSLSSWRLGGSDVWKSDEGVRLSGAPPDGMSIITEEDTLDRSSLHVLRSPRTSPDPESYAGRPLYDQADQCPHRAIPSSRWSLETAERGSYTGSHVYACRPSGRVWAHGDVTRPPRLVPSHELGVRLAEARRPSIGSKDNSSVCSIRSGIGPGGIRIDHEQDIADVETPKTGHFSPTCPHAHGGTTLADGHDTRKVKWTSVCSDSVDSSGRYRRVEGSEESTRPPSYGEEFANSATSQDSASGLDPGDKAFADYLIKSIRAIRTDETSGWAEIDATLGDIDEQRIRHCKEDIDTLLVFAGLFSAVLTAFLIESYQTLSPDPVVQLLTQISMQTSSYAISSGFMNSTQFGVAPTFEVSASNFRINGLWFTSLIISLTTASLGILIKQWLHEYKIVDPQHANLRARLRIRQFRYPGLVKWKVFELAAVLPLLIQVSLGLFLLGLCTFTWSINTTIGRSSAILVLAWVSFFTLTAFAPAISSDCPFKIPMIAPLFRPVRLVILRFWSLKWMYIGPALKETIGRRPGIDYQGWRWLVACWYCLISFISVVFCSCICVEAVEDAGDALFRRTSAVIDKAKEPTERARLVPLEETEVARDEQKDLEMLVTVDDVLLDDDLLGTTMRSVIAKSDQSPDNVINFVVSVLSHRLPYVQCFPPNTWIPCDIRGLSARAWEAIVNITCDTLEQHLPSYGNQKTSAATPASEEEDMSWICNALSILQSRSDHPDQRLQRRRQAASSLVVQVPDLRSKLVSSSILASWPFENSWLFFRQVLPRALHEEAATLALDIYRARYCRGNEHCQHASLSSMLRQHPPSAEDRHAVWSVISDLFTEYASRDAHVVQERSPDLTVWLEAMISWMKPGDIHSNEFVPRLFGCFRNLDYFAISQLLPAAAVLEFLRSLSNRYFMDDRLIDAADKDAPSVLYVTAYMFNAYGSGDLDGMPGTSDVDILHLCNQCSRMYRMSRADRDQEAWCFLLSALSNALHKFYDVNGTSSGRGGWSDLACWCLEQIVEDWSYLQVRAGQGPALVGVMHRVIEALHLFVVAKEHYSDKVTERRIDCLRGQAGVADIPFRVQTSSAMKGHGLGGGKVVKQTGAWYTA